MMRAAMFSVLLFASAASVAANPSERIEQFLRKVSTAEEADKAFDELLSGTGFAEQRPQLVVAMKSQTKMAMGLYGKLVGVEKIREDDLSPSLKRLVYIQKFEKGPFPNNLSVST